MGDVPEVQKIRNSEVENVSQTEIQALNSHNVNQESKLPRHIQTKSVEPVDLSAIHLSVNICYKVSWMSPWLPLTVLTRSPLATTII